MTQKFWLPRVTEVAQNDRPDISVLVDIAQNDHPDISVLVTNTKLLTAQNEFHCTCRFQSVDGKFANIIPPLLCGLERICLVL